jgi:uncharacterized protein
MPTFEDARTWYPQTDNVHDFGHIERVYALSARLALEEGADREIVHAAALLHDVEGSTPGKAERKDHHLSSAEFAEKILAAEGWAQERIQAVQHCIRAHRFRGDNEAPQTIEAKVLFDADKLDVLGAVGVARTIAYATLAETPLFVEPSLKFITKGNKEPGERHSAYHEYLYKLVKVRDRLFTPAAKRLAQGRHDFLVAFFEQLAAEMRGEK